MTAKRCGTCGGTGTVNKMRDQPAVMGYCGPNGERWPQEPCPNCYGTGWTGTPDGPMTIPESETP